MSRCIITVTGKDAIGIIAKVCSYLAEEGINVLDISQTIVDGYFNMMAIVDVSACVKEITTVSEEMKELGLSIGVDIHCQREEIFEKMHRL